MAHATDRWSFTNNFDIKQHRTIEERLQQLCALNPHCPVYVDTMKNHAYALNGALPERLYIVLDSVVVYEGGIEPHDYRPDEVKDWLTKYFKRHCVFYGVESWSGVLEWSHGVEFGGKFWSGSGCIYSVKARP